MSQRITNIKILFIMIKTLPPGVSALSPGISRELFTSYAQRAFPYNPLPSERLLFSRGHAPGSSFYFTFTFFIKMNILKSGFPARTVKKYRLGNGEHEVNLFGPKYTGT
jgi:hypothetical protein